MTAQAIRLITKHTCAKYMSGQVSHIPISCIDHYGLHQPGGGGGCSRWTFPVPACEHSSYVSGERPPCFPCPSSESRRNGPTPPAPRCYRSRRVELPGLAHRVAESRNTCVRVCTHAFIYTRIHAHTNGTNSSILGLSQKDPNAMCGLQVSNKVIYKTVTAKGRKLEKYTLPKADLLRASCPSS